MLYRAASERLKATLDNTLSCRSEVQHGINLNRNPFFCSYSRSLVRTQSLTSVECGLVLVARIGVPAYGSGTSQFNPILFKEVIDVPL